MITIKWGEIHVFWRENIGCWCARSLIGDYGIAENRNEVGKIAADAMLTAGRYHRLVIHRKDDKVESVITRIKKGKPSSQFFQDFTP